MSEPGYWKFETSGVLQPAIEAYLNNEPLTDFHIAAIRAYLRQWIVASAWDQNPFAGPDHHAWLTGLRAAVDGITDRSSIEAWIDEAEAGGVDPL